MDNQKAKTLLTRKMKFLVAIFLSTLALSLVLFVTYHLTHLAHAKKQRGRSHIDSFSFVVNDVVQPTQLLPKVSSSNFVSRLAAEITTTPDDLQCAAKIYKERSAEDPESVSGGLYGPKRAEWLAECQGPAGLVDPDAQSIHPNGFLIGKGVHPNGFVAAIFTSFAHHYPLLLRPEHLWTLILQGVAAHVHQHPELLRHKFVTFEQGKMELLVKRNDFRLHQPGNDWAGVVSEFIDQIQDNMAKSVMEVMSMDFTSSTQDEKVCSQVTVMNAVQPYFDFKLQTTCGYPKITLEGTLDDWIDLRTKAEKLIRSTCLQSFVEFWLPSLLPVLEKFVEQRKTVLPVDVSFWQSMCKRGGTVGSGSVDWLNGWFNVFFPVLNDKRHNPFCVPYSPDAGYVLESRGEKGKMCDNYYGWESVITGVEGPDVDLIPRGVVSANISWDYFDLDVPLQFRAGFLGAEQRKDGTIAPSLGWYIRYGRE